MSVVHNHEITRTIEHVKPVFAIDRRDDKVFYHL